MREGCDGGGGGWSTPWSYSELSEEPSVWTVTSSAFGAPVVKAKHLGNRPWLRRRTRQRTLDQGVAKVGQPRRVPGVFEGANQKGAVNAAVTAVTLHGVIHLRLGGQQAEDVRAG
jgi:hypothetical protein